MALLKLKQFRSNLSYNTGTNVLTVSGSLVSIQSNPNFPAVVVSGSFNLNDAPNIASGSITGSNGTIDGGEF
jgi:hypothetical protein